MNGTKGQLWSLDAVLAGVLFTLALGLILSQTELHVFSSQQERNARELQQVALFASNALASKADLLVQTTNPLGTENIRCGPNFENTFTGPQGRGWSYDNDLSWMENCFIDRDGTLSPASLGLPPGYSMNVSGAVEGNPLQLDTSLLSPDVPFASITRKMFVFPTHAGTIAFRDCLDGSCVASYLSDITISVWRS
jgi:hypothetical protein